MTRVVVVGDVLLDVDVDGRVERMCPDAPVPVLDVTGQAERPGGAGLAALLLAGAGESVTVVSAVAADQPGDRLRELLTGSVRLLDGPAVGGTAVKCRWRSTEGPLLRTDCGEGRPGPGFGPAVSRRLAAEIEQADAVLVSDYGRGVAADRHVRRVLTRAAAAGTPVVWDPHPRGPRPVAGVSLVTPNAAEAAQAARAEACTDPADVDAAAAAAAVLLARWRCAAVAVTLGSRGAVLVTEGAVRPVAAPAVDGGDPCGAGDAFAGRLAALLGAGTPAAEAVAAAVEHAAGFVGRGGASTVGTGADGSARVAG